MPPPSRVQKCTIQIHHWPTADAKICFHIHCCKCQEASIGEVQKPPRPASALPQHARRAGPARGSVAPAPAPSAGSRCGGHRLPPYLPARAARTVWAGSAALPKVALPSTLHLQLVVPFPFSALPALCFGSQRCRFWLCRCRGRRSPCHAPLGLCCSCSGGCP